MFPFTEKMAHARRAGTGIYKLADRAFRSHLSGALCAEFLVCIAAAHCVALVN